VPERPPERSSRPAYAGPRTACVPHGSGSLAAPPPLHTVILPGMSFYRTNASPLRHLLEDALRLFSLIQRNQSADIDPQCQDVQVEIEHRETRNEPAPIRVRAHAPAWWTDANPSANEWRALPSRAVIHSRCRCLVERRGDAMRRIRERPELHAELIPCPLIAVCKRTRARPHLLARDRR